MSTHNGKPGWRVIVVAACAFGAGAALAWAGLPRPIPDRSTSGLPTAPDERAMWGIGEMLVLLESADIFERSKAWQDLGSAQRMLCHRLVTIVGSKERRYNRGEARRFAADLLKNCFSQEASAVLVQHIDYRGVGMTTDADSPYNGYPCAMTLSHYPHQATATVFSYLAQTSAEKISPEANKLYAWLFIAAYGRVKRSEPGKDATFLIELAKDKAREEYKGNYQRLLDTVKELSKIWPD